MATAHSTDSPGDGSQEHGLTVPVPLPRRRCTPRLRTMRHRGSVRPSTVWPCAEGDLVEGTGLLANWLLTAVSKTVTTYTQPGQRVLLLDAVPLAPPASWFPTESRSLFRPGPYGGLHEASWAVVRLGRAVQTRTATAHADVIGEHPAEFESGPGLRTASRTANPPACLSAHGSSGPDSTVTAVGPDRYDLVITAVEPRTVDWFRPADWAGLLARTGVLAVVTHGVQSRDRPVDPADSLVRAAHQAGLRYLDRIALLRVPVHQVAAPSKGALLRASVGSLAMRARRIQAHDDLFVFTRRPAPSAAAKGEETSDG